MIPRVLNDLDPSDAPPDAQIPEENAIEEIVCANLGGTRPRPHLIVRFRLFLACLAYDFGRLIKHL
jgi:hypothetical protein